MNSRLLWVWALSFISLISACKKESVPVSSSNNNTPASTGKPDARSQDFVYLSAKGRMQVEQEATKLSSGITLRVAKDSVIWLSIVPALGIEAARLKLTQDSVYMLNRLQRNYFTGDYSYFKDKFAVDVNFAMVQAILLGNYLPNKSGEEKILAEAPLQHIRQEQANLLIDQFLDINNFKLKKLSIKDQQTNNSISVDYSEFEQIGNKAFAKVTDIAVQPGQDAPSKTIKAAIDYNNINPAEAKLAFPFSVPSGYVRQ